LDPTLLDLDPPIGGELHSMSCAQQVSCMHLAACHPTSYLDEDVRMLVLWDTVHSRACAVGVCLLLILGCLVA
jgi:hypothetical protein